MQNQNELTNTKIRPQEWISRSSPSVVMATGPGSFQSRVAGTCFRFPRFSFSLVPRAFFLPSEGAARGWWLVQPPPAPNSSCTRLNCVCECGPEKLEHEQFAMQRQLVFISLLLLINTVYKFYYQLNCVQFTNYYYFYFIAI